MKAIVYHEYGTPEVLRCEEVEKPAPGVGEVLIRVRAASINPLDWRMLSGRPYLGRLAFGLRRPKNRRPGVDVAGVVEAIGAGVKLFKPGDEVFGACRGSLAEYACAPESKLAAKPAGVTFEQAAAAPVAGLTALQGLRDKGRVKAGQKVLINGAAGGVGTFAVQIAKLYGAEVTGVCSTGNVELVQALGAAHVVDYTREDFTKSSERYDLIFDCFGHGSPAALRRVMKPEGVCVNIGGPHDPSTLDLLAVMLKPLVLSLFVSQSFVLFIARANREDLRQLGELIETGKVEPFIGRRYALGQSAEALAHLEQGHARGKVVINVGPDD
ncbi:MAG TPA: NAD(P)-dependent alcohol dehydrogenase [Pyrinomonadaceae bacterium]|nr:NAD(P)-dependent alcohol dehydrogenase [Pyrinomonadaceae bacterium]